MSRTKIVGYLMVVIALLNFAVDALNGGGIDFAHHFNTISAALGGAGLVFLRDAVGKIEGVK